MTPKEKKLKYMREYNRRPEIQARQKRQWRENHEKNLARLKEYRNTPEAKTRSKERYVQKRTSPEWIAARRKKHIEYRAIGDFKNIRKDYYLSKTYGISL